MYPVDYSRSAVYYAHIKDLDEFSSNFTEIKNRGLALIGEVFQFRKALRKTSNPKTIIVMSPSHKLVIFLKFLPNTTLVLDAGWSLTESSVARKNSRRRNIRIIKNYCIDFLAFHLANLILLESQHQIQYTKKIFLVRVSKLAKLYTGFNEKQINSHLSVSFQKKWDEILKPYVNFQIITFRGKYNDESGLENLVKISHRLAHLPYLFIVITDKLPQELQFSKKTIVVEEFLRWDELRVILNKTNFYVGQLSFNKRLRNTIPHKAFEAGFFEIPYITAKNPGIQEYLDCTQAIYLSGDIVEDFRKQTIDLNEESYAKLQQAISRKYQQESSQLILGNTFLELILDCN
jgi:hypothetical protein